MHKKIVQIRLFVCSSGFCRDSLFIRLFFNFGFDGILLLQPQHRLRLIAVGENTLITMYMCWCYCCCRDRQFSSLHLREGSSTIHFFLHLFFHSLLVGGARWFFVGRSSKEFSQVSSRVFFNIRCFGPNRLLIKTKHCDLAWNGVGRAIQNALCYVKMYK